MNYKKIILGFALSVSCFAIQQANAETFTKSKKTESEAVAANVYWTDNAGKVSYSINATTAPIVKIALKMFANDMKAVTGYEANEKSNANLQIFQLDLLSNKEFSAVEKLGVPLHKIITVKDAYYIGTRKNKVIVVGSNARGTAYAIMHLSQLAGVSPMAAWNDLKPQPRRSLSIPTGKEWIEIPRIEFRGLALNNSQWMKPENYSRIARLMLRLKANTLWQVDGKHEADYDKAVVDSFDICMAENYKVVELTGKKHKKKHKKTIENVKMVCDDNQMAIGNLSPGLLLEMLNNEDYQESKSAHHEKSHRHEAHNDEECAWIANVVNPKKASLQLSMMMDLAWSKNAIPTVTGDISAVAGDSKYTSQGDSRSYLQNWLCGLFGTDAGKRILPLMEEYYRLTSIRQPAFMTMPYGDTKFHSGEFGNELERYLYLYDQLKAKVARVEKTLPAIQNDGYFEVVKYPIYSAALIAEKELEAQEARDIARPGLFYKDDEAKAAAAVSLNAYNTLRQLNAYYQRIGKGKWKNFIALNSAEMQAPQIPGKLSDQDVKLLKDDAFDRTEDLQDLSISTSDIIAKNAWEWTTVSYPRSKSESSNDKAYANDKASSNGATQSIQVVPLLGHSNKAVKLAKGASLNYTFATSNIGDARFTLAVIPSYLPTPKNMRVSVSIDHATPVVCQMNAPVNSKEWKFDLWRGQALKSFYVNLLDGYHDIEIKALDDDIIIDQWVLDFDVDREYYVFPVSK